MPRLKSFGLRLRLLPLGIALVLIATGVLPKTYIGRRSVRDLRVGIVLADAANRIKWQAKDIDRILVFVAVLTALAILALQTLFILFAVFVGDAHASSQIFSLTPEAARNDVVLVFLDQVFGVPGVFNTGTPSVGSPLHNGIHALLGFYSQAMMVIAVLIVVYYVVVVVGEAAQSGKPFGGRFNSLWAPIRLVLALGLLVPLGSGLNAAQYLTLYTAKLGSALASNAWAVFANRVTDGSSIVLAADIQATRELVKNIFIAEVCREALAVWTPDHPPVQRLLALDARSAEASLDNPDAMIAAARSAGLTSIGISWSRDTPGLPVIENTCGRVDINLSAAMPSGSGPAEMAFASLLEPLTRAYVSEMGGIIRDLGPAPREFVSIYINYGGNAKWAKSPKERDEKLKAVERILDQAGLQSTGRMKAAVERAYASVARDKSSQELLDKMVRYGWGGAGIWYVKVGQLNQRFQQAVRSGNPAFTEIVSSTPREKEAGGTRVSDLEQISQTAITQATRFAERLDPISVAGSPGVRTDGGKVVDPESWLSALSDRRLETVLNFVFRTERLRLLRTNPTLDPMIVLVSAGDRLIQSSMAAFAIGLGSLVVGDLADVAAETFFGKIFLGAAKLAAATLKVVGPFMLAIATVGFMAGVVLYYLLPLFPFIYFFFAIAGWGLSIVEALCAGPIWALGHLRIDGEGMPGPGAVGGYFILFEIFLRPILIVAGLIIGYSVFGAGAYFLSTVFDSVTNSLDVSMQTSFLDTAPSGDRGASSGIDNFVYTILFTIIVYGLALSCFKMTDKLPDNILRWMNPPGPSNPFAGGKDAPDMQGTVLAGAGAVVSVSDGLKGAVARLGKKRQGSEKPTKKHPGGGAETDVAGK